MTVAYTTRAKIRRPWHRTPVRLRPTSCLVTFDRDYSPSVQATIDCPVDDFAAALALDPRTELIEVDLTIVARNWLPGTVSDLAPVSGSTAADLVPASGSTAAALSSNVPVTPLFAPPTGVYSQSRTLRLEVLSRRVSRTTGLLTLQLVNSEQRLRDTIYPFTTTITPVVDATLGQELNAGLAFINQPSTALNWLTGMSPYNPAERTIAAANRSVTPGQQIMDRLTGFSRDFGYEFYADDDGRFWCTPYDHRLRNPGGLSDGALGPYAAAVVGDFVDQIDANDWMNAGVVTYEYPDATGKVTRTAVLVQTEDVWPPRHRTRTYRKTEPPGAFTSRLAAIAINSRKATFTAVIDVTHRLGMLMQAIEIGAGPVAIGRVRRLDWQLPQNLATYTIGS